MRAHALGCRRVALATGIPDELDEGGGSVGKRRVEDVGRAVQGCSPLPQQPGADARAPFAPLREHLSQLGLGTGPEVRAFEAHVCGCPGVGHGLALRADVDLLAPVGLACRQLSPGAVVAAEVRALRHLDAQLLLRGQCEERAGHRERSKHHIVGNPVPGEVEEPELMGGAAQVVAKPLSRSFSVIEDGQVQDRQPRLLAHGWLLLAWSGSGSVTIRALRMLSGFRSRGAG